jgi:hypothetical protein
MADTKISDLTAGDPPVDADMFPIARSGANRKLTWANLKAAFASTYEVATFADLPAAGSVVVGRTYTVLGAICTGGATGTRWQSNGTVWRPAGRQRAVETNSLVGVGPDTNENILWSPLFSAGVLSGCSRIGFSSTFSADAADAGLRTVRWRCGAAGTAADPLAGSPYAAVPAASRQFGHGGAVAVLSTTAVRSLGIQAASALQSGAESSFTSSSVRIADWSIDSLASAVYISLTCQQAASPAAVITLQNAAIYIE